MILSKIEISYFFNCLVLTLKSPAGFTSMYSVFLYSVLQPEADVKSMFCKEFKNNLFNFIIALKRKYKVVLC